jgi:putative intracellular protease/amidase
VGNRPSIRKAIRRKTKRLPQIRFKQDQAAQKALSQTVKLADVQSKDYDTVFYVGGHGPMWDLAESQDSIALLESFGT